jgi:hypothetical protein
MASCRTVQRVLIALGIVLLVAGLLWPWLGKVPLGRLPGDLVIDRGGFRMYLPLTTMLLASGFVSLVLWLVRRS